jgi:glycosyltransferase 2 family protein
MPPEEELEKKESRLSKILKLAIKIVITALCFWYISTKIDFSRAWDALLKANWWYLLLAVLSFMF